MRLRKLAWAAAVLTLLAGALGAGLAGRQLLRDVKVRSLAAVSGAAETLLNFNARAPITNLNAPQAKTNGPLRVSPANPRYFEDSAGNIVYLTGSHTWLNLQGVSINSYTYTMDYAKFLDFLAEQNHNFFRLWMWEEAAWVTESGSPYRFNPMPYLRPGPGTALDGQPKFDLNQFNPQYFSLLRKRVQDARSRGMYVSVMLFNGWSISYPKGTYQLANPWRGHPYNKSNNINGVNGDPDGNNSGDETHTLALAAVTRLQEAYVRKVIDTVYDLDNVLFEISNESPSGSEKWQYAMIDYIRSYEKSKGGVRHPVGMTVEWPDGNDADLYQSKADWISINGGGQGLAYDQPADGKKVVIADTDHLCGICGDRNWVWRMFTRGYNPIFMDQYDDGYKLEGGGYNINNPNDVSLRRNMGYTRYLAGCMDLKAAVPNGALASTGYALANPSGANPEYLVYLPPGGAVRVNLSAAAGTLNYAWLNPATGNVIRAKTISGGSASQTFTPPFTGDAVLYIFTNNAKCYRYFDLPYNNRLPMVQNARQ